MTERSDGAQAKIAAIICAVFLGLAAWFMFDLREGNIQILEAVSTPKRAWVQTFHTEWEGADGKPYEVTLAGAPGEPPAETAIRFEEAVVTLEKAHPRRR